jgi:hypothetical protein
MRSGGATTPLCSDSFVSVPTSPEAAKLIRQLMQERHLPAPPADQALNSICVVALCQSGAK